MKEHMEILTQLVLKYGAGGVYKKLVEIEDELWGAGKSERQKKYEEGKARYQATKEKKVKRGEVFSTLVKVGDYVEVEGTKNKGVRLVEDLKSWGVVGRHIKVPFTYLDDEIEHYPQGSYITEHGWDKVKRIIKIKE